MVEIALILHEHQSFDLGNVEWVERRSIARWKDNSHAHLPRYPKMFEITYIQQVFGCFVLHINPNNDLRRGLFFKKNFWAYVYLEPPNNYTIIS